MKNIKIKKNGSIPEPTSADPENCQFSYLDFTKMEIIGTKTEPTAKDIKDIMNGKQMMIWVHPLSATSEKSSTESYLPMLNDSDKNDYADLPSCICTPYGSMIPQIIVPSHNKNYTDNGLTFDGNTTQAKKHTEGYNWSASKITDNALSSSDFSSESSDVRAYGERWPHKYITNENSARHSIDVNGLYHERKYECNTTGSSTGKGAFAFCYKFIHLNSQDQTDKKPCIKLQLSSTSSTALQAAVVIPGAGNSRILASVGEYFAEGSLGGSENDLLPPQCAKGISGLETTPLFMYPIFGGFILTGNALASMKTDGSGKGQVIFVKYDKLNTDMRYRAVIGGGDVDSIKKEKSPNSSGKGEIEQYIAKNEGDELMKWFPSIYQQSAKKSEIRIDVPDASAEGYDMRFGSKIGVTWRRSVGRFAYCPVFFYGHPKFTLYFKGEYRADGKEKTKGSDNWEFNDGSNSSGVNSGGSYYFYTVCCSKISDSTDGDWSDNSSDTSFVGINKNGASRVVATPFTNDTDKKETIYKAEFEFKAKNDKTRFPLEIFGSVCVYQKNAVTFPMYNSNGSFDLDLPLRSEFSAASDSSNSNCAIPDAITDCSVSYSLDDTSGTLSLDGYALMQGIAVAKQQQDIGTLCLDVDGSEDSNSTSYPLFRGYAMQVGTRNNGNSDAIEIQLSGVGKKLEDIKMVCCPFWDGDKLIDICRYIEHLANVQICMINGGYKAVTKYSERKTISNGEWYSNSKTIVNDTSIEHPFFRVPRSFDWRNPAVRFENNTSVMEVLQRLGEFTGCKFVVEPDGTCVFYELNDYGYPYYVDNQKDEDAVSFGASSIISLDLTPDLEHKYNTIVTMGFLQRKDENGKILSEQNVEPGVFYTRISDTEKRAGDIKFPWSRVNVGTETGMFTNPELAEIHANRVKFSVSDIYKGSVTVYGNTMVNHFYQKVKIIDKYYFVISINHNVDATGKTWTTSYGLTYFEEQSNSESK